MCGIGEECWGMAGNVGEWEGMWNYGWESMGLVGNG